MKKILLAGFVLTLLFISYQSFTDEKSASASYRELQAAVSTETQETMSIGGKGIAIMTSLLVVMIVMLTMRKTELTPLDWEY